jgi:hypothetical protein
MCLVRSWHTECTFQRYDTFCSLSVVSRGEEERRVVASDILTYSDKRTEFRGLFFVITLSKELSITYISRFVSSTVAKIMHLTCCGAETCDRS